MPGTSDSEPTLGGDSVFRLVALPRSLEERFRAADREQRRKQAVWGMLLGIVFYVGLLCVDWLIAPDVYALNVLLRLGVGLPIGLAVVARLRDPGVSEVGHQLGVGTFGYVCVVTVAVAMARSTESAALAYFSVNTVVLCFTINLVGMLTVAAAILCLLVTVTTGVFVAHSVFASLGAVITYVVLGVLVTITCVFANWCLLNQRRRNFLVTHRDRMLLRQISRQRDLLEQLAAIDPLTGLANRRGFDAMIAGDLAGAGDGVPLAVAMIDIDCFKAFNDTYGHPSGDAVLKVVAEVLATGCAPDARLGRMGGEEFAVAVVGCDHAGLSAWGERLCRAVADRAIPHRGSAVAPVVTISVGLAGGWTAGGEASCSPWLALADEALYAAKRAGRDRAVVRIAAPAQAPAQAQAACGPAPVTAAPAPRCPVP